MQQKESDCITLPEWLVTLIAMHVQIVQKTPDLAELAAKAGVGSAIQKFFNLEKDEPRSMLTGVMILGG
jgi:hypothetical protein